MNCAAARVFTAAIADGELDSVPVEASAHVASCPDCQRELEWQQATDRALTMALAAERTEDERLAPPVPAPDDPLAVMGRQSRLLRWGTLAAAIILVVTLGAGLLRGNRTPDTRGLEAVMVDAAHHFGASAEYSSSDAQAIDRWSASHGVPAHVMQLTGETPIGARMDQVGGRRSMTVIYSGARGRVEVLSLIGSAPLDWPRSETKIMDGKPVGLVRHSEMQMVVVTESEIELAQVMDEMR